MPVNLSANALLAIHGSDVNSKPLVQVLDIKLMDSTQERYHLLLSDSVTAQQAMLATQLNDRVSSGRVRKGSIVQLTEYICSTFQNRKYHHQSDGDMPPTLILGTYYMETIIPDCDTIGKPVELSEFGSVPQNPVPDMTSGPLASTKNNNVGFKNSENTSSSHVRTSSFYNQNNTESFRPTVQPPYQPPPNYKHHGAIMRNEVPARIIPIAALNPYQGHWAVKARVTAKGDLRHYNNAKGDGKVFSFDLLDSDGGEIRVTCFNAVADRFYDAIEVGKVYVISKGSLKPAQKNFNHLKNEWEIFLEATSSVDLCPDEDSSIPRQQILNLKDQSERSVELTLWGDFSNREGHQLQEMVDNGTFPILAVKAGKVNDFSGKSISTISATQLFINPDCPEANTLRDWFDRGGKHTPSHSISRELIVPGGGSKNEIRKSLMQIKDEGLGRSGKPDWITVKIDVQVQDHTGLTWVTAFQETGEEILGCSAKELYVLKYEGGDDVRFVEIIRNCLFTEFLLRLKIKEEIYGDEQKVKITVFKAEKVNYPEESRFLFDMISKSHMR
ncbi:Rpa1ap [Orobanche hederae]